MRESLTKRQEIRLSETPEECSKVTALLDRSIGTLISISGDLK
jgi:hypothetical protein